MSRQNGILPMRPVKRKPKQGFRVSITTKDAASFKKATEEIKRQVKGGQ